MADIEVTEDGLVISGEGAAEVQKRLGWMQEALAQANKAIAERDEVIAEIGHNRIAVTTELEVEIRTCYAQIEKLRADIAILEVKAGDWSVKNIRRTVRDSNGLITSIIDEQRVVDGHEGS